MTPIWFWTENMKGRPRLPRTRMGYSGEGALNVWAHKTSDASRLTPATASELGSR